MWNEILRLLVTIRQVHTSVCLCTFKPEPDRFDCVCLLVVISKLHRDPSLTSYQSSIAGVIKFLQLAKIFMWKINIFVLGSMNKVNQLKSGKEPKSLVNVHTV